MSTYYYKMESITCDNQNYCSYDHYLRAHITNMEHCDGCSVMGYIDDIDVDSHVCNVIDKTRMVLDIERSRLKNDAGVISTGDANNIIDATGNLNNEQLRNLFDGVKLSSEVPSTADQSSTAVVSTPTVGIPTDTTPVGKQRNKRRNSKTKTPKPSPVPSPGGTQTQTQTQQSQQTQQRIPQGIQQPPQYNRQQLPHIMTGYQYPLQIPQLRPPQLQPPQLQPPQVHQQVHQQVQQQVHQQVQQQVQHVVPTDTDMTKGYWRAIANGSVFGCRYMVPLNEPVYKRDPKTGVWLWFSCYGCGAPTVRDMTYCSDHDVIVKAEKKHAKSAEDKRLVELQAFWNMHHGK